jgi:chemosensory pili system protein ChpA (sensor histidine kinase/response regulator)
MPTILVVDDSLSQRRALEQLLSDAGYKVRTARDGIEAVNLLPLVKPALVLTDLEMPRMNGIELTAHIRAQSSLRKLPVIMITSRTTQKHRQMADEAGIDFYLVKPVRNEDLLTKMQTLMEMIEKKE